MVKSKDKFRVRLKETVQKIRIHSDVEAILEKAIVLKVE